MLGRSGADPAGVVFELTETAAATASEVLRAFGARIEPSAARSRSTTSAPASARSPTSSTCRCVPEDRQDFVRGIADSAADRAIVQSIVTIADSLGMRTIAEGVEDEATLEVLRELGVDFAQGYHLGRPARSPSDAAQPAISTGSSGCSSERSSASVRRWATAWYSGDPIISRNAWRVG